MTWIDFVVIGIVFVSCFISVMRGFVREALSLASWVVSFLIAWHLHGAFSAFFRQSIEHQNLRLIVAFFVLFVMSLIVFTIVNFFAGKLVERTGLTGADRVIGVIFGFFRGILIVTGLVALAGLTHLPQTALWHESLLLTNIQAVAIWLTGLLPSDIAKNFVF